MGRRAEFTDEQVAEAGEDILAEGRTVTGWALRTRLGGGKPERLLAVWRAARGETAPVVGPLPEEALRAARDGLRSALDDAAATALERVQEAAAEMHAAAEARRDATVVEATREAAAAVDALEAELGRAAERAEDLAGRLALVAAAAASAQQAEKTAAELREQLSVESRALALSTEKTVLAELRTREAEDRERAALERAASAEARLADAERREQAALERAATAEARLVEAERREQAATERAEAAEARPTLYVGSRPGAPETVLGTDGPASGPA